MRGYFCAMVPAGELRGHCSHSGRLPREKLSWWWGLVRGGWDPARPAVFFAHMGQTSQLGAGTHRAAAVAEHSPGTPVPVVFVFDRDKCAGVVELSDRGKFPFALEPPPPGVTVRA